MMFETERLAVRRIEAGDGAFILAILNDPGFLANIGDRGVRTVESAEAYIRDRIHNSYARHGFGMFRVALKDGDVPIGIAGFVSRDGLDCPDIGFAYLVAYGGQGYGYEAGRAMLEWGRDTLGLDRIVAVTAEHNQASAALLCKLGFREQGKVSLPGHDGESRFFVEQ